jgi:hypothetical protein
MFNFRFFLLAISGKTSTIYVDIEAENEEEAFEISLKEYGEKYYITKCICTNYRIR